MLLAVAEIMFRMISQIFKGIEILVFNFPSGASAFDEYFDVCLINEEVGYPTAMKRNFVIQKSLRCRLPGFRLKVCR